MPEPSIINSLRRLLDEFVEKTRAHEGGLPRLERDDSLPDRDKSQAVVMIHEESNEIEWRPAQHGDFLIFSGLEQGLNEKIHEDLKYFYGAFWSEGICCQSPQGLIRLIQVWNDSDLEMLRENLLGHAFMKRKRRQPLTFFLGVGDGENIITLENGTGCIYLEIPGRRPHLKLANNLAEYLDSLEITLVPYAE